MGVRVRCERSEEGKDWKEKERGHGEGGGGQGEQQRRGEGIRAGLGTDETNAREGGGRARDQMKVLGIGESFRGEDCKARLVGEGIAEKARDVRWVGGETGQGVGAARRVGGGGTGKKLRGRKGTSWAPRWRGAGVTDEGGKGARHQGKKIGVSCLC